MTTNTVITPVGTFTRKSTTTYGFAAVVEAAENPEQGLRVVGNRKGDPALGGRVRYHLVWSRTAAGAQKNAESYVWAKTRVVGVFPVVAPECVKCGAALAQHDQEICDDMGHR